MRVQVRTSLRLRIAPPRGSLGDFALQSNSLSCPDLSGPAQCRAKVALRRRVKKTMGCPRGTTLAAALLYLAYYLRCCVKDLAVRSPAVGALAANRMPAYLYRSNNDTKLLAHLARAATAGADEPAFLGSACAARPPSFNHKIRNVYYVTSRPRFRFRRASRQGRARRGLIAGRRRSTIGLRIRGTLARRRT